MPANPRRFVDLGRFVPHLFYRVNATQPTRSQRHDLERLESLDDRRRLHPFSRFLGRRSARLRFQSGNRRTEDLQPPTSNLRIQQVDRQVVQKPIGIRLWETTEGFLMWNAARLAASPDSEVKPVRQGSRTCRDSASRRAGCERSPVRIRRTSGSLPVITISFVRICPNSVRIPLAGSRCDLQLNS